MTAVHEPSSGIIGVNRKGQVRVWGWARARCVRGCGLVCVFVCVCVCVHVLYGFMCAKFRLFTASLLYIYFL